jgi:hypothetical protein
MDPIKGNAEENGLPLNLAPAAVLDEKDRTSSVMPSGGPGELPPEQQKNSARVVYVRDDVSDEFGSEVYDQMYRDPAIHAAISGLRMSIMASGPRAEAPKSNDPDFAKKADIAMAATKMLQRLHADIYDLTLAIPFRHALAEIHWVLVDDPILKKPVYSVRKLSVKNRNNYDLVADYDLDFIGVVDKSKSQSFIGNTESITPGSIVPAEKLILFSPFRQEGDLRGANILRPAYNPWRIKSESWGAYYRYLNMFSIPNIVVTASAETQPDVSKVNYTTGLIETNGDGTQVMETREMANYRAAKNLVVGGANVLSLGPGATAELMFSQGSGEAFTKAFEALDKQMIMAILVTARAIVEAQKSSKADSESSLDIFDVLVNFIRGMLELTLYEQVLCRWYRYNIGDDVEN